jgi:hypothetical protein
MSTKEKSQAAEVVAATVLAGGSMKENAGAYGRYTVVCIGADGQEKWRDEFPNLVVNVGLQYMNDTFFAGTTLYRCLVSGSGYWPRFWYDVSLRLIRWLLTVAGLKTQPTPMRHAHR